MVLSYARLPRLRCTLFNSHAEIIGTGGLVEGVKMEGTQFRYVIKFVTDMNKAVAFYRDTRSPA